MASWSSSSNAVAVRAYRARNRELVNLRTRAHAANHRARKYGVEGQITVEDVRSVLKDAMCVCGVTEKLTIDHVIPMSEGGRNVRENLQALCRSCNARKFRGPHPSSWSNRYSACQMCGGTERKHRGRGLCFTCYQRVRLGRAGRRHAA